MSIKEVFDPPLCSECGRALTIRNSVKYGDDVRRCITPSCYYMTDIRLRQVEDYKHNLYHEKGEDPRGGKFNEVTEKWECPLDKV
ncbi:MAG: hypothetical protein ACRD9Q_08510 [Nitrososphaeraceae archaeon]